MTKIKINDQFPDFKVDTIYKRSVQLQELLNNKKTALIFLRYEGCTLCRFDMLTFKEEYQKITNLGAQLLVVLQSDPDVLTTNITEDFYPYEVICDPNQTMYSELEITAAKTKKEMLGPGSMKKLLKVKVSGLKHGDYEGNEMQLPALFILDPSLKVTYAHYAAHITDMPTIDEIVELLSK